MSGPGAVRRTIEAGFRRPGMSLVMALHFQASAVLAAIVATAPVSNVLHASLDGQPRPDGWLADGGLAVLEEITRVNPGCVAGAASPVPLVSLLLGALVAVLAGGAYSFIASEPRRGWPDLYRRGFADALAWLALAGLGLLVAAALLAITGAAASGVAALARGREGASVPSAARFVQATLLVSAAIAGRSILGTAMAIRARGVRSGVLGALLAAFRTMGRQPLACGGLTAAFSAPRAALAAAALAAGQSSGGGWIGAEAAAQLLWAGFHWLGVAEMRARAEQVRGLGPVESAGSAGSELLVDLPPLAADGRSF